MYYWIYQHIINTLWFILIVFSIPFGVAAYLLYKWWANSSDDGNNEQEHSDG